MRLDARSGAGSAGRESGAGSAGRRSIAGSAAWKSIAGTVERVRLRLSRRRSHRLALRGRLALLAAAAVALSVMAAAFVSYHLVDNQLNSQLNQNLIAASHTPQVRFQGPGGLTGGGQAGGGQAGSTAADQDSGPDLAMSCDATGARGGFPGNGEYETQTVGSDGTVCLPPVPSGYTQDTVASTAQDQAVANGTAPAYFRTAVTSTGVTVRVYTAPVPGEKVAIQSIAEVTGLDSALSSLAWKLWLVAAAGMFLAVLAGLLVAHRPWFRSAD